MTGEEFRVIGQRVPRVDALSKATGQAQFTADMRRPGMLVGKVLHSRYPHARILNIDTTKAARVPGVRAIITGRDTLGVKVGQLGKPDEPAMAVEKVRYIGEAVAAVGGTDEDAVMEALDLIEVDYEPLPALFDAEAALKAGAFLIHEDIPGNVSIRIERKLGDLEKGFAEADLIREETFTSQAQVHCSLEPHAAVAVLEGGRLTLWSSIQGPFYLRRDLAQALGMAEGDIRVIKPHVGGGFGGKREMTATDFCAALLAQRTGRPVRVVFDREEEFYATRQRHPMKIKLKLGMKRDGRLTAKECLVISDGGAYKSRGPGVIASAGETLMSLFRAPNVHYVGIRAYTNNAVSGAFRGFGRLQTRFAEDSLLETMAEELGLDPVEVRLKNALKQGETLHSGTLIASCAFSDCIKRAAETAGYQGERRKPRPNEGTGMGCEDYVSGARLFPQPDASGASIELNEDGTVKLLTGSADIGQGSDTTLAQIAAEVLGVSMDRIKILAADTQTTPPDLGTYASRVTYIAGNAVLRAATEVKEQLAEFVAAEWDCLPE